VHIKFISKHKRHLSMRVGNKGRIERMVDDDTNLRRHVDFTSLLHIATPHIYALLNCNDPPIYIELEDGWYQTPVWVQW
jgi:hypothetical protein